MSTKDFSNKQEKLIASFLNWDVVSGSGSRACHPGDIIGDEWLGECKTHETSNKSIFFSQTVWEKIVNEAIAKHRKPVLFTDDGSQRLDKTWCIFNHFVVPEDWTTIQLPKKFKVNITLEHEYLIDMYSKLSNDTSCYLVNLGKYKVALLPLRLFNTMINI